MRLRSFNFDLSAEVSAPFYERVAGENVLSIVKKMANSHSRKERPPEAFVRFRVITASVCLSIIWGGKQHPTTCYALTLAAPQAITATRGGC